MATLRERIFSALDMVAESGIDTAVHPSLIAADILAAPGFDDLTEDQAVEIVDIVRDWQRQPRK